MAFEHEDFFTKEWKSIRNSATTTEKLNLDTCFDCNICLDFAHEPVVTLCGHLYCWSCIYKWLFVQSASLAPDEPPQCPVCKDHISHINMVPLYGRGHVQTHSDHDCDRDNKATLQDISIPPRPPASGIQSLLAMATSSQTRQQLPYRNPYQSPSYQESDDINTPVMRSSSSSRWRRQEMLANKSLNRISIFLFVCFVLCFSFIMF